MILDSKDWQTIRECCQDEAAFERLQKLLLLRLTAFGNPTDLDQSLDQQSARYAAILNVMPDRVFLVSRNGENLDFKGTQEDSENGVRRETIIGTNLRQFLPPEIAQQCLDAIARTLDTGCLQTFEYQIPKAWEPNAGELREYEVRLVVSGEDEVLAIERDITDRKRAEQALHQSEARNRAFLNAIPDLMFRISRTGVYLDIKADHDSDFAVPPGQMLGKTVYDVLPFPVAQQRMDYIEKALQTGEIQLFEYQLVHHGEPRDYEARIVVSGEDEVLAIMRDISDRKRITARQADLYAQVQALNASLEQQVQERTAQLQQKMQELQELSQLKDDFLHAVSHDLRTPIMGLLLVLRNLQKKCSDAISLPRPVLERMVQSSERQLQMINSLLEAHSSEVQGVLLNYEQVNLAELARSVVEDLEPLVNANRATLTDRVPLNLPPVAADPTQIRRVLENLLTNALKHNSPGLSLTLDMTIEGDLIRCRVQDNGIGLSQSDCDALFERYAKGSQSRRSPGIGLGLYLCRQIITAHGGQIGAISAPGQGATFWFTLPLTDRATDHRDGQAVIPYLAEDRVPAGRPDLEG